MPITFQHHRLTRLKKRVRALEFTLIYSETTSFYSKYECSSLFCRVFIIFEYNMSIQLFNNAFHILSPSPTPEVFELVVLSNLPSITKSFSLSDALIPIPVS